MRPLHSVLLAPSDATDSLFSPPPPPFPTTSGSFPPIGVSLNKPLKKKKNTATPSLPPCSLCLCWFYFSWTKSGPTCSICSKGLCRQCQMKTMCHSQSIAIFIGIKCNLLVPEQTWIWERRIDSGIMLQSFLLLATKICPPVLVFWLSWFLIFIKPAVMSR